MNRLLLALVAPLVLVAGAGAARACRIAPRPPIPIVGDYEAIFLATATSLDNQRASLRIDEMLDGHMPARRIHLDLTTGDVDYAGRGPLGDQVVIMSCGIYGSAVVAGARLVLAVRRNGRQFRASWMRIEDAAVADDFFALYRGAARRAERRRLLTRWRLVNRYQGPVPLSDPAQWLPPHGVRLGWGGPGGFAYVGFHLAPDGSIARCELSLDNPPSSRNATICDAIRQRRFAPPIFARERLGMLGVRWNPDPPQP